VGGIVGGIACYGHSYLDLMPTPRASRIRIWLGAYQPRRRLRLVLRSYVCSTYTLNSNMNTGMPCSAADHAYCDSSRWYCSWYPTLVLHA